MENNLDYSILEKLNHWIASSTFLSEQAVFLNDSGFSELIVASSLVTLWFLDSETPPFKIRQRILLMILSLIPTYIVARLMQNVFHRSRPIINVPLQIPKDLELWHSSGRTSFSHYHGSFPSDHEALLFIVTIVFFTIDRRLGIFSFLFSVYYGFMRISVGYLWPSDVIGGAVLGSVIILLILLIQPLLTNHLERLLLQFKRYPARLYTVSFLFLSDFQQNFVFLKKISSLLFHQRLFH